MRALLFGTPGENTALPLDLVEMDDPVLPGDDWVLLRTRMTGICGSDSKQVLMDFDGDRIRHLTKIWNDGISLKQLGWM